MIGKLVKSHNLGILVSPTPASGSYPSGVFNELENITSVDFSFSSKLEEIPQYGRNTYDYDVNTIDSANLNFSYYIYDFKNESAIGLNTEYSSGIFSNDINQYNNDRNFYLCAAPDSNDIKGTPVNQLKVFPFSNCFVSSYSATVEVGSYPTATVSIDALSIGSIPTGDVNQNPSIPLQTGNTFELPAFSGSREGKVVVKPGDINVSLGHVSGLMYQLPFSCVQSFSLEVAPEREEIKYLAQRFPAERKIKFPIPFTVDLEVIPDRVYLSRLEDFVCDKVPKYLNITFNSNKCSGKQLLCGYSMRNLKLVSQNFNIPLNEDQTISLRWRGQLGSFNEQDNGVFLFRSPDYTFSTDGGEFFGSAEGDVFSP